MSDQTIAFRTLHTMLAAYGISFRSSPPKDLKELCARVEHLGHSQVLPEAIIRLLGESKEVLGEMPLEQTPAVRLQKASPRSAASSMKEAVSSEPQVPKVEPSPTEGVEDVGEGDVRSKFVRETGNCPEFPEVSAKHLGFVLKRAEWGAVTAGGGIDVTSQPMVMNQYGFALLGQGRSLRITDAAPGDAFLIFHESTSGASAVGRFPVVGAGDGKQIARAIARSRRASLRPADQWSPQRRKERDEVDTSALQIAGGRMSPYRYEMQRMVMELARYSLAAPKFRGGLLFMLGDPSRETMGSPPAAVLPVLGAIMEMGMHPAFLKAMLPHDSSFSLLIDGEKSSIGWQQGNLRPFQQLRDEGLGVAGGLADALREAESAGSRLTRQQQLFSQTHLVPLFAARYAPQPERIPEEAKSLVKRVRRLKGKAQSEELTRAYRDLHAQVQRRLVHETVVAHPSRERGTSMLSDGGDVSSIRASGTMPSPLARSLPFPATSLTGGMLKGSAFLFSPLLGGMPGGRTL